MRAVERECEVIVGPRGRDGRGIGVGGTGVKRVFEDVDKAVAIRVCGVGSGAGVGGGTEVGESPLLKGSQRSRDVQGYRQHDYRLVLIGAVDEEIGDAGARGKALRRESEIYEIDVGLRG